MRTTLCSVAILGACGTTPAAPPDVTPIPSAKPGEMPDLGVMPPPACLTRYRFSEIGVSFDCPTTFVGGDPHHYVTTCHPPASANPYYFPPPDRDEVELDAAGHLVHEVQTYQTPPTGWPAVHDQVNTYTADGHLQAMTLTDGAGTELFHRQVDARDDEGRPVAVSLRQVPLEDAGVVYEETAASSGVLGYDDGGRLVDEAFRYTSTGHLYMERTTSYDDLAMRRDFATFFDDVGVLPHAGPPNTVPGYDQLDVANNVLETAIYNEPTALFDFRYDEQGRVVTAVWSGVQSLGRVIESIYDCP